MNFLNCREGWKEEKLSKSAFKSLFFECYFLQHILGGLRNELFDNNEKKISVHLLFKAPLPLCIMMNKKAKS